MYINILCLLISTICYFYVPNRVGSYSYLGIVIVMLSIQILGLFKRKEPYTIIDRQIIRIFPILLFSFVCVHFQQFIDLFLGSGTFKYREYSDFNLVTKSAFLSSMGFSSLVLGYRYGIEKHFIINNNYPTTENNHKRLKVIFNIFFLIFTCLFVLLNGSAYLTGNYSQETMLNMQGTINAYSIIFMQCCMYASTIETCKYLEHLGCVNSIFDYIKGFSPIYYICLFLILFFNLVLGDRGPLITYTCIYVYGYVLTTKKKLNPIVIISSGALLAICLSAISIYRTDENKSFSEFNTYRNTVAENGSISPFTAELAGSTYATLLAVESTPDLYPYRYGLFSLNNIVAAIPFSSSIFETLGIHQSLLEYGHSSSFITWYGHGGDLTRSGLGSSTIADAYIDFGPLGVVILLFLIGYLIRFLDEKSFLNSINSINNFVLITAFVLFANAFYFPRSMIFFFVKDIVWTWVFYTIVCKLFGKI